MHTVSVHKDSTADNSVHKDSTADNSVHKDSMADQSKADTYFQSLKAYKYIVIEYNLTNKAHSLGTSNQRTLNYQNISVSKYIM